MPVPPACPTAPSPRRDRDAPSVASRRPTTLAAAGTPMCWPSCAQPPRVPMTTKALARSRRRSVPPARTAPLVALTPRAAGFSSGLAPNPGAAARVVPARVRPQTTTPRGRLLACSLPRAVFKLQPRPVTAPRSSSRSTDIKTLGSHSLSCGGAPRAPSTWPAARGLRRRGSTTHTNYTQNHTPGPQVPPPGLTPSQNNYNTTPGPCIGLGRMLCMLRPGTETTCTACGHCPSSRRRTCTSCRRG